MIDTAFHAGSLTDRYAFLDDCPEHLFRAVVTLPVGALRDRIPGVLRWRAALLDGRVPEPADWPPPEVAAPALRAVEELGLARFCAHQPELTDELLLDLLAVLRRTVDAIGAETAAKLRELEQLERTRLDNAERAAERTKRARRPTQPTAAQLAQLAANAERHARAIQRPADATLLAAWEERARAWSEIADVFGDLGDLMGRGRDLTQSVLRHVGWSNLLQLRDLVARLPQLREIVRALGRMHLSDDQPSVTERVTTPMLRLEEERREVPTPLVPAETRGIERSGEIARMLPAEAALLLHPTLRLLWHARRAERALLTYRVEGTEIEVRLVERQAEHEVEGKRPRPVRGPILAVIDTSGSMHGEPETVAKALVLEAVRVAHAEKRRCFIYLFSGPRNSAEHELGLSAEGIGALLRFLGQSFGGGTDPSTVTELVVRRLKEENWKKADVLVVSDGEFSASAALVAQVAATRADGTRFHGVQIGTSLQSGLHALCDPVHMFDTWAAAGGWR
jgi:uncharacterized protein with von Willebrand factor type A (vWA) domain